MTLSGNSAQFGGGLFNEGSSNPIVHNSILWGDQGGEIVNIGSTTNISRSIVQGGYPNGTATINADPLFVAPVPSAPSTGGDLHLWASSPAIDAGDHSLVPAALTTDRDGMPRVVGPTVDLGAYEAQPRLSLTKSVDAATADPGQRRTYTFVLANSGAHSATATLSDTLPTSLIPAGPISVEPGGNGTAGSASTLLRDIPLSAGQTVTVTLPVTVAVGLPAGTVITNTASLTDSTGLSSASSSAVLTIANVAPSLVNDLTCVNTNTGIAIPVLGNDQDLNGDRLTVVSVDTPAHGTASTDGRIVTYRSAPGFRGAESFSYTVSDGALSASATIKVTVGPGNYTCSLYLPLIRR